MVSPKSEDKKHEERVKEIEEKLKQKTDWLAAHFKYFIYLIVILIALRLVASLAKKNAPPAMRLTQEEKKALAAELKKINQSQLSAQEEVIETYNIMLRLFNLVNMGREEGTPAKIFADRISRRLPNLGKHLTLTTRCFDNVLYGDQIPPQKLVEEFRLSSRRIFHQFDVKSA